MGETFGAQTKPYSWRRPLAWLSDGWMSLDAGLSAH